jgi:serine/alanine adding enzyme
MLQVDVLRNPEYAGQNLRDFIYQQSPAFFQSLDFLKLLYHVPGFKPFILTVKDNQNIIATLAGTNIHEGNGLKSWVSERTVIYGHAVIANSYDASKVTETLLRALPKVTTGSLFTQFRNDNQQNKVIDVFRSAGYHWHDRLNLIKPIHNLEEAWAGLSASRRRQINNSKKNGLAINHHPGKSQVEAFYYQLHKLYKFKVKKPLPSLEFFLRFHELSSDGKINGKILLTTYRDKVIGGIICPFKPGANIYEWYVCGLDEEYLGKKIHPSVMATWAAMEFGHRQGCCSFDFMGLGIPGRAYGVRDFKARFGGEWVNHGRWSRINSPALYSIAELGYNFLRLLKEV